MEMNEPLSSREKKKKKKKKKTTTSEIQQDAGVEDVFLTQDATDVKQEQPSPTGKKKEKVKELSPRKRKKKENIIPGVLQTSNMTDVEQEKLSPREKKKKKPVSSEVHQMPSLKGISESQNISVVEQEKLSLGEKKSKKRKRKSEFAFDDEMMDFLAPNQTQQVTGESDSNGADVCQGRECDEQYRLNVNKKDFIRSENSMTSHKKRKKVIEGTDRDDAENPEEKGGLQLYLVVGFMKASSVEKDIAVTSTSRKHGEKSAGGSSAIYTPALHQDENNSNTNKKKKKKKKKKHSEKHQVLAEENFKIIATVHAKEEQLSPRDREKRKIEFCVGERQKSGVQENFANLRILEKKSKKRKRKSEFAFDDEMMDFLAPDQTQQVTGESDSNGADECHGRECDEQYRLNVNKKDFIRSENSMTSHKKRKKVIEGTDRDDAENPEEKGGLQSYLEVGFMKAFSVEKDIAVTNTSRKHGEKSAGGSSAIYTPALHQDENNSNTNKKKKKKKKKKHSEKHQVLAEENFKIMATVHAKEEQLSLRDREKRKIEFCDGERQKSGVQENFANLRILELEQMITGSPTKSAKKTGSSPRKKKRRSGSSSESPHKTSKSNDSPASKQLTNRRTCLANILKRKSAQQMSPTRHEYSGPTVRREDSIDVSASDQPTNMYKSAEFVDDSSTDESETISSNAKIVRSTEKSELNYTHNVYQNTLEENVSQRVANVSQRVANIKVTPQNSALIYCGAILEPTDLSVSHTFGTKVKMNCYICDETMASMSDYIEHLAFEHRCRSYQCERCHNSMGSKELLEQHQKVSCKKKSGAVCKLRFRCPLCPMVYSYRKGLKRHHRAEHDPSIKTVHKCRHCGSHHSNDSNLKQHEKKCGEGLLKSLPPKTHKTVPCEECGRMFSSISSRSHHARIAHRKHVFDCICGKKFLNSRDYYQHIKTCEIASL